MQLQLTVTEPLGIDEIGHYGLLVSARLLSLQKT
jgi:hypothetical protein